MTKRKPSEVSPDWETGCFGHEANNLALTTCCNTPHCEIAREEILPKWQEAMETAQKTMLTVDPGVLELTSLAWLLANQLEFYEAVVADVCASHDNPEEEFERLTKIDKETIRDWFCWLHRHMVQWAKEKQRWEPSNPNQLKIQHV